MTDRLIGRPQPQGANKTALKGCKAAAVTTAQGEGKGEAGQQKHVLWNEVSPSLHTGKRDAYPQHKTFTKHTCGAAVAKESGDGLADDMSTAVAECLGMPLISAWTTAESMLLPLLQVLLNTG